MEKDGSPSDCPNEHELESSNPGPTRRPGIRSARQQSLPYNRSESRHHKTHSDDWRTCCLEKIATWITKPVRNLVSAVIGYSGDSGGDRFDPTDPELEACFLDDPDDSSDVSEDLDDDLWEWEESDEYKEIEREIREMVRGSMPIWTWDRLETKEQCMVCLEEYKNGDGLRTLPCCHEFHQECIDKWLDIADICPICRKATSVHAFPSIY